MVGEGHRKNRPVGVTKNKIYAPVGVGAGSGPGKKYDVDSVHPPPPLFTK